MHPEKNTQSLWIAMPIKIRNFIKICWSRLGFSKGSGTQLRFEFDMLFLKLKQTISIKQKRIFNNYKKHLEKMDFLKNKKKIF
jgi:hypothetical protein